MNTNKDIITIAGVKLTHSFFITRGYNLTALKTAHYQIKANGYFNKRKPVLDPLDWIKSDSGQKHIRQIYAKTESVIHLACHCPLILYTSSYYVWLGYLKHCIGNIDAAISAELAN